MLAGADIDHLGLPSIYNAYPIKIVGHWSNMLIPESSALMFT